MMLQRFLSDLTIPMGNCIQDGVIVNQDLVYVIVDDAEEEYISFVKKLHELTKENGKLIADIGGKLQHRDVNFNEITVVKWAMQGMQNDIMTLNKLSKFLNDQLVEAYDEYKNKISDPKQKKIFNLSIRRSIDDITEDPVLLNTETDVEDSIKEEVGDDYFSKAIEETLDKGHYSNHIDMVNDLLGSIEEEPNIMQNLPSRILNESSENGNPVNKEITKSEKEIDDSDIPAELNILNELPEEPSTNHEQDTNNTLRDVNMTIPTNNDEPTATVVEATNNVEQLPEFGPANADDTQMEIDLSKIKKDDESIYSYGTDIVPDISNLKEEDEISEALPRVLNGEVDTFQKCNDILNSNTDHFNNSEDDLLDLICDNSLSQDWSSSNYEDSDEDENPELNNIEVEDKRNHGSTASQMNIDVAPRFYDMLTKQCNVRISKEDMDICKRYVDEYIQKNEIERLLDIESLKRKRKSKHEDRSVSKSSKIIKKRRRLSETSSSSCSYSFAGDLEVQDYNSDYQLTTQDKSKGIDEQIDDFVLDNIIDSGSDTSTRSTDDEIVKKKSKHDNVLPKRNTVTSAWKKDPLLTCSLSTPKEKIKNCNADVTVSVDLDSSDSSNIEILSDDQQAEESPEPKETIVNNSKGKGRKNIRAVYSDQKLSQSTVIANTEEKERIGRLRMKHILPGDEDNVTGLRLDDEIVVHPLLSARLKKHQREGVKFMWDSCYESAEVIKTGEGIGCILAHCMGLGKTYQIITLLHTLFVHHEQTRTKHVLILCPVSTILNWTNEFNIAFDIVGCEDFKVHKISDSERVSTSKINMVNTWLDSKGVLIMGYECFLALSKQELPLLQKALVNPGPDLVICDEGHLLKNGNATRSKMLKMVNTKRKIILTGTPMQNNLREYYHMVQIVKPNLLGTFKEYNNGFVNPIMNGQYDDSTEKDIQLMKKRSHVLYKLLKGTVQRVEGNELCLYLPPIKDYVLIIPLHELQRKLYKKAIETMQLNKERRKLFMHYYQLLMIWTHPVLLQMQEKAAVRARPVEAQEEDDAPSDEVIVMEELPKGWWHSIVPPEINLMMYSPKFQILFSIIRECMQVKDKLLVFSSLLVELDAIEFFLKEWQINYLRMDGNVPPDGRERLCRNFQSTDVPVFILSHKVGSLGLNLTAANRVVLMDVSWNPAVDSQSIFRIFRFGQTKQCFVYRLVSQGTMEEVVYERAITKQATASRVVDDIQISRHYKCEDLLAMYRCKVDPIVSPAIVFRKPMDNILAVILQKNKELITSYHEMESLLKNRPDEELNEEEMNSAWDEYNKEKELNAIQQQVPQLAEMAPSNPSCSNMFNQFLPRNNFKFACNKTLPLSINNVFISSVAVSRGDNTPQQRNPNYTITDGEVIELE